MAEETPQPGGHCLIVHHNRLGTDVKLVPRQGPIAQHAYPAGRVALAPARLESQTFPPSNLRDIQSIKGLERMPGQWLDKCPSYLRKHRRVKNRLDASSINGKDGDDHTGQEK